MTPSRPHDSGDGAPDLVGVKATDHLLDRLARGEGLAEGHEPDAAAEALGSLAAFATATSPPRPSLDDLLSAAGLVLRPADGDLPGALEADPQQPEFEVLTGIRAVEGRTPATSKRPTAALVASTVVATAGEVRESLARTTFAQRAAHGAHVVADRTGRGLRRVGIDTDRMPRVSPMVAAAAAVVAFGLTGVATGVFSADPVSRVALGEAAIGGADADEVAQLLDKARIAARAGRDDEATRYYLRASVLVHALRSGPGREALARQVENLRVQLGLPEPTETSSDGDLTPAEPTTSTVPGDPGGTVGATPEPAVPGVTPTPTPTPTPTTTTPEPTPQPTPEPSSEPTSEPTPAPTEAPPASPDASPASEVNSNADGESGSAETPEAKADTADVEPPDAPVQGD